MAKKSLLLDSDVVIDFHKNDFWRALIAHYVIYVGSVSADIEIKCYPDQNETKIPIDIQSYIDQKIVFKISASALETAELLAKLKVKNLDGLDAGELECVTIMKSEIGSDLLFCIKDHAAIKAVAYLDLDDRAISIEKVYSGCGISTKKVTWENSEKRFKKLITEGKFSQL